MKTLDERVAELEKQLNRIENGVAMAGIACLQNRARLEETAGLIEEMAKAGVLTSRHLKDLEGRHGNQLVGILALLEEALSNKQHAQKEDS
jgi:hypothetical protein